MNRIRWYGPAVVLSLTVLLVMVAGPALVRQIVWAQTDSQIKLVKDGLSGNQSLAELSKAFRNVAKAVEPSVVHIQVSARRPPGQHGGSPDELWRRMPRWPFGPQPQPGPDEDGDDEQPNQAPTPRQAPRDEMKRYDVPQPYGNGSGWVFDKKGHIITNNHVVEGAEEIKVRFQDETERVAKVIGTDPKTDIAVLKVEGDGLHPASLATDQVEQGDIVFAFGSPLRFEFSMSQGIVSAKGRQLGIIQDKGGFRGYENFIQTDAAINPGNSGGPLTNIYGQVIGMNTAIASRTGGNNGLGFAIPVDMVAEVATQIITKGKVTRGYLGVFINDLNPKLAKTFAFEGKGVLVEGMADDGPAAKAGIIRGDIITKVDGKATPNADELRRLVANVAPGTKVKLEVFRDKKSMPIDIVVAEQPAQMASAGSGEAPNVEGKVEDQAMALLRKLGFDSVATLTNEMAMSARIKFVPGVLVRGLRQDSAAAAANILRGSVITEVGNTPVKTIEDLANEIKKHEGELAEGLRLSVSDNGQPRYVLLEMKTK